MDSAATTATASASATASATESVTPSSSVSAATAAKPIESHEEQTPEQQSTSVCDSSSTSSPLFKRQRSEAESHQELALIQLSPATALSPICGTEMSDAPQSSAQPVQLRSSLKTEHAALHHANKQSHVENGQTAHTPDHANGHRAASSNSVQSVALPSQLTTPLGFEIDSASLVRIMAQTIKSLNLKESFAMLQRESGVSLELPLVTQLSRAVTQGDWTPAKDILSRLGLSAESLESALDLVAEQHYLELLDSSLQTNASPEESLSFLQHHAATHADDIASNNANSEYQSNRIARLASYLMCSTVEALHQLAQWSGDKQQSRVALIDSLQPLLPKHCLLPSNRLPHLLEQALQHQIEHCKGGACRSQPLLKQSSAHSMQTTDSSTHPFSLLEDHACTLTLPDECVQLLTPQSDESDATNQLLCCAWSHSGLKLATANKAGKVFIYRFRSASAQASSVSQQSAQKSPTTNGKSAASPTKSRSSPNGKSSKSIVPNTDLMELDCSFEGGLGHGAVWSVHWNFDDTKLLCCGDNSTTVRIYSVAERRLKLTVGQRPRANAKETYHAQFCSRATVHVATSTGALVHQGQPPITNYCEHKPLGWHADTVTCCAWIGQTSMFVSGSTDRRLILWDSAPEAAGTVIHEWHGHAVVDLDVSKDGKHIIVATGDNQIIVYDVASREQINATTKASSAIAAVCLSSNGRFALVTCCRPAEVHLWDLDFRAKEPENALKKSSNSAKSQLVQRTAANRPSNSSLSASASASSTIASSSPSVISCPLLVRRFSGPQQQRLVLRASFFGPDDAAIVQGSETDAQIYCWNRSTGDCITTLSGHSGPVSQIAWTPDRHSPPGRNPAGLCASVSDDHTCRIWRNASEQQATQHQQQKQAQAQTQNGT